jgi:hypothetical protein
MISFLTSNLVSDGWIEQFYLDFFPNTNLVCDSWIEQFIYISNLTNQKLNQTI